MAQRSQQVRGRGEGAFYRSCQDTLEDAYWPRACRFRRMDACAVPFFDGEWEQVFLCERAPKCRGWGNCKRAYGIETLVRIGNAGEVANGVTFA